MASLYFDCGTKEVRLAKQDLCPYWRHSLQIATTYPLRFLSLFAVFKGPMAKENGFLAQRDTSNPCRMKAAMR